MLLTFQLTKPNTGEPLTGRYIDVQTDLVRSIELVGPSAHFNNEPVSGSSHRFLFTFSNGDTTYLYAAGDRETANARLSGLREVLRGNKSVRISVFSADKDAERPAAE